MSEDQISAAMLTTSVMDVIELSDNNDISDGANGSSADLKDQLELECPSYTDDDMMMVDQVWNFF